MKHRKSNFFLYTSNRLEVLIDILAEIVRKPRQNTLEPETLIVQSRGMEHWISMQLAEKLGIWANCRFPFPNSFVQETITKALPNKDTSDIVDAQRLTWKLMNILSNIPDIPQFSLLHRYLSDKRQMKRYQLASRIADVFDQYTIYRSDIVTKWENGDEDHWQAHLWRLLFPDGNGNHRASLKQDFFNHVANGTILLDSLPERISVFGISALPPYHTEFLETLSHMCSVHLFMLNPCAEYWDDIVSEREMGKVLAKKGKKMRTVSGDLHMEQGNPLLAAMGAYGRDFIAHLHSIDGQEYPVPLDPDASSLLTYLQSDILYLYDRAAQRDNPPTEIDKNDRSVQIHSCHNPLREIEVLYDNLLDLFESIPDLHPSDIVVMTPDLDPYVPFIEAIFNSPEEKWLRIPFNLADRSIRQRSRLSECFFSILELSTSRYTSNAVIGLLEAPAIQDAFSITPLELDTIKMWVRETRICWAIDKTMRERFDVPGFEENTWKAGFDRLFLGYALPGSNEHLFSEILGYDAIEGGQAVTLGKLVEFVYTLFQFTEKMNGSYPLGTWSTMLTGLLDRFFASSNNHVYELQSIRSVLMEMVTIELSAECDEPLDLETIQEFLKKKLDDTSRSPGFLSGGVTFCAMMPMRSIPFKVVYLLGMNDTAFPRTTHRFAWDVMAIKPRRGDRSFELEDRYLFLEAILSARECLHISYIGQNSKDNSSNRPSVLVQELIDYCANAFYIRPNESDSITTVGSPHLHFEAKQERGAALSLTTDRTGSIRDILIVQHRLQAFNPLYFTPGNQLFSFSRENCSAASNIGKSAHLSEAFFPNQLPPPHDHDFSTIALNNLLYFFRNPSKYLISRRLGLVFEENEGAFAENEPFEIAGLEKYLLTESIVPPFMKEIDIEKRYSIMKAGGLLPHGVVGRCRFVSEAGKVVPFVKSLQSIQKGDQLPPLSIDTVMDDRHIHGRIDNLWSNHLVHYRYAKLKAKDLLTIWINHIFLSIFGTEGYPRTSILHTQDSIRRFMPLENATDHLNTLIELFIEGHNEPLPFFPQTSWAYAEYVLVKRKNHDDAINQAKFIWKKDKYNACEANDTSYTLCFREKDPFDSRFCSIALDVYGPILRNMDRE